MNTDSKRLRVLKLLCAWLAQEVRIANGYKFDLAEENVFRGRLLFTDADPDLIVSINDSMNPDRERIDTHGDDSSRSEGNERWSLQVQGWTDDDWTVPCDNAYELMANIKKALMRLFDESTLEGDPVVIDMGETPNPKAYCVGGLVNGASIEPGTVRAADQPTERAQFWMRLNLQFSESVSDPYRY